VGRAGQLLTQMIENTAKREGIPLERKDVYICNVVKCRPPGNRDPCIFFEQHNGAGHKSHGLVRLDRHVIGAGQTAGVGNLLFSWFFDCFFSLCFYHFEFGGF